LNGPHAAVTEVVNVVGVAFACAQAKDVFDRADEVDCRQRLLVVGRVDVELTVQTEATNATEAVAGFVEELLVEELTRLLQLRRVTRTQALVDLE
jgi:23S rRNA G2445 N2-methylase RlmL